MSTDVAEDRAAFAKRVIAEMRETYGLAVVAGWRLDGPVPSDGEARQLWAHAKARAMGWIQETIETREPGDEA